ncbi:MAG: GlsB/YeaQ/YmgE family stress response membrane protein [Candidatus Sericytochromatia bacterium]
MSIISAIVVGIIIGIVARLIMPGRQAIGMIMTIVLGIVGALAGSWITTAVTHKDIGHFDIISFIVGVVVAVILIAIYAGITGRGARARRT